MTFTPIDETHWERREYLDFFKNTAIYMTVEMDITTLYREIKARGLRLYPALIWCAAKSINDHKAFLYGRDEHGNIGIWNMVHPYYTVPRQDNPELFSMKCTTFSHDFKDFYEAFLLDYAGAERCGRLLCDEVLPPNICGITATPGIRFSSFSFGGEPKEDFAPFTLYGKFRQVGEHICLPVSGEFSHAVNDGLHVSRFFSALERNMNQLFEE